jgi:hypothetical protein
LHGDADIFGVDVVVVERSSEIQWPDGHVSHQVRVCFGYECSVGDAVRYDLAKGHRAELSDPLQSSEYILIPLCQPDHRSERSATVPIEGTCEADLIAGLTGIVSIMGMRLLGITLVAGPPMRRR